MDALIEALQYVSNPSCRRDIVLRYLVREVDYIPVVTDREDVMIRRSYIIAYIVVFHLTYTRTLAEMGISRCDCDWCPPPMTRVMPPGTRAETPQPIQMQLPHHWQELGVRAPEPARSQPGSSRAPDYLPPGAMGTLRMFCADPSSEANPHWPESSIRSSGHQERPVPTSSSDVTAARVKRQRLSPRNPPPPPATDESDWEQGAVSPQAPVFAEERRVLHGPEGRLLIVRVRKRSASKTSED